jgi:hypothetical protein
VDESPAFRLRLQTFGPVGGVEKAQHTVGLCCGKPLVNSSDRSVGPLRDYMVRSDRHAELAGSGQDIATVRASEMENIAGATGR